MDVILLLKDSTVSGSWWPKQKVPKSGDAVLPAKRASVFHVGRGIIAILFLPPIRLQPFQMQGPLCGIKKPSSCRNRMSQRIFRTINGENVQLSKSYCGFIYAHQYACLLSPGSWTV